jgi:hypothetical protein
MDPDFERKWEQFKINHDEFDKRFHAQKAEIEAERRRIEERTRQFKEEYDNFDQYCIANGFPTIKDVLIENPDGSYHVSKQSV